MHAFPAESLDVCQVNSFSMASPAPSTPWATLSRVQPSLIQVSSGLYSHRLINMLSSNHGMSILLPRKLLISHRQARVQGSLSGGFADTAAAQKIFLLRPLMLARLPQGACFLSASATNVQTGSSTGLDKLADMQMQPEEQRLICMGASTAAHWYCIRCLAEQLYLCP